MVQQFMMNSDDQQAKPLSERQVKPIFVDCATIMGLRKAHLQNSHNANRDTITKRSNGNLIEAIFVASKTV